MLPAHLGVEIPVVLADVVARADGRHGVAQRQVGLAARLEGDQLQPLHVHGVAGRVAAEPFCGASGAFGQQVAQPAPVGDLFDHAERGRGVAKGKGLALVVCGPQVAPLKHLHGKRQREAQRGGVEAKLVAQVVGAQHGIQVAHADGRPHGAGNLLVNARGTRVEIGAVQRVDALDALVGAAGAAQLRDRAGEIGRFLKGLQPGKRALLIVVGAEGRIQAVEIDPATEAGRLLLPAAQVVERDAAGKVRGQLFQGCRSKTGGCIPGRSTTALRRLEPITAPMPMRAAW